MSLKCFRKYVEKMRLTLVLTLCVFGLCYNITSYYLAGFNFDQGLVNVYPYASDLLVTSAGLKSCPAGCASCNTKTGCISCTDQNSYPRYNKTAKRFACYCEFGTSWDGLNCTSFTLPKCIEPATESLCGITYEVNGAQVAKGLASGFNITAFTGDIYLHNTMDALFATISEYYGNNGFKSAGLAEILVWMRDIAITMPEEILRQASDNATMTSAANMKAILGYW